MSLTDRLNALDQRAERRFPSLFHESPRTRARLIVVLQVFTLVCLLVGTATDNDTILGAMGGSIGGTLGVAIRMLRSARVDK